MIDDSDDLDILRWLIDTCQFSHLPQCPPKVLHVATGRALLGRHYATHEVKELDHHTPNAFAETRGTTQEKRETERGILGRRTWNMIVLTNTSLSNHCWQVRSFQVASESSWKASSLKILFNFKSFNQKFLSSFSPHFTFMTSTAGLVRLQTKHLLQTWREIAGMARRNLWNVGMPLTMENFDMQKSISTFQAQGPHIIGASAALFPTPEDHEFLGIGRGRAHPFHDMRSGVVESRVLCSQRSRHPYWHHWSSRPVYHVLLNHLSKQIKNLLVKKPIKFPTFRNIQPLQIKYKKNCPTLKFQVSSSKTVPFTPCTGLGIWSASTVPWEATTCQRALGSSPSQPSKQRAEVALCTSEWGVPPPKK